MPYSESLLTMAIKGAAAGLAGTVAITVGMQVGPQLLREFGLLPQHAKSGGREKPTEKLAETVSEEVAGVQISEQTEAIAGQAIHWSYGMAWGALYGVLQSRLRLPHLLHGVVFGGIVATVASTVVPAIGLTPPPTKQPIAMSAMQMVLHLIYGEVVALTFDSLTNEE